MATQIRPGIYFNWVIGFAILSGCTNIAPIDRCFTIDFETILGQPSTDGQLLGEQFLDSLGVQFRLEGDGIPQIAKVGNPLTAFDGAEFGPDSPAPGHDIGSSFLTDDGTLSGQYSPPLIITLDAPAFEGGGEILDIDYEERFLIQLFGQKDQLLKEIEIIDGIMPGTGNGSVVRWSFYRDSADVYRLRMEGFRTTPGAFGLGFDNFSFCLAY